jgi:nucleotide-binding universal stress UspA family protein
MLTVLVAIDGSENSLRALRHLLSITDSKQLHVHLLSVADPVRMREVALRSTLTQTRAVEEAHEQDALELLQGARAILTQGGVSHDAHAKVGPAAETIVSFARDYHCQLIAMGTRGMGAVASFMIGSVANRVVHLTDLPVLLVK